MALSRGGFDNQFNPYSNIGRKPQELSPSGANRNHPIGSGFSSNVGGASNKMGFFSGKKEEGDSMDGDFFYNKSFPYRNNMTDSGVSTQMSNLNLYGNHSSIPSNTGFSSTKAKEATDRSASPNWGSGSGWGQSDPNTDLWNRTSFNSNVNKGGGSFPHGFGGSSNLSNVSATSRQNNMSSNSLLQFSRTLSQPTFSNLTGTASQSLSDFQNNFTSNFKLLSGQSSPRSGLLTMSQQQQQQVQNQQQSQRGVIGQLPSMSMQGHSSPSHSPGLNINSSKMGVQSSRSSALPPSSINAIPNSSVASSNFPGFIGGQIHRSMSAGSNLGQNLLSSVLPSVSPIGHEAQQANAGPIGAPGSSSGNSAGGSGGTAFDTDFPALANRLGNSSSSRPGQNSFSFVMSTGNKNIEGNKEFQIQNEDFPALPGAAQQMHSDGGVIGGGIGGLTQTTHLIQHQDSKEGLGSDAYSLGSSCEQILKDGRLTMDKKSRTPVSGIQTNSSGVITNIPSGMVTDQFGMIGLLTFIRAAETEPYLVTLALGSDLTTLGLNLNSTESLYHTFGSPFSDSTCKPHEIDFYAPQEYLISSYIRDKLAPIKLGRYGEDLLFYLYYTNCGDILQLAAAAELYARDWRYHKDERVWITRFPGVEPQIKTNTYERGTYYYFDPQGWRKVAKEFHVEYERLEEKPTAQALQQQQQQQQQQQVA